MSILNKMLKVVRRDTIIEPEQATQMIGYANELDVVSFFALLGLVAKASGKITQNQIDEVQRVIDGQVPSMLHELARESFRDGRDQQAEKGLITDYAFQLYWNKNERWLEPLQVLNTMLLVAFADGEFSSLEEYIIDCTRSTLGIHMRSYWILRDTLGERFGIDIARESESFAGAVDWASIQKERMKRTQQQGRKQEAKQKKEKDSNTRARALKALELDENASEQEIKDSYRKLVKKYHPDILQSGAASDDELKRAVALFCQIQEAYELLSISL